MKKVELLAPAGNYEALTGAIAAGADAVYLGGNSFGARAYADNFSGEEICEGIKYAHIFHKKIYLTVNTLVKEREFAALYDFLLPFYETGLDGVIIQDFGVFTFIREYFPGLDLHVSTQMTITGAYGASLLKQEGACRIVPARELSLSEIKAIKAAADIEIEAFIHGAMCYCYSGQCLFSSILGGRSGNRGRCAQPCRLPYHVNGGREEYPLSMKDMCTINILPQLIEAGIDSFKIEGRMKKPEYAAGVTAIYRKYIDQYYEAILSDGHLQYHVSDEDMDILKSLYIRSTVSEGYYHQHNGKDMITLSSPAYSGSEEGLLNKIRAEYIQKRPAQPVSIKALFKTGRNSQITLSGNGSCVTLEGSIVQKAVKQPLSMQKLKEQLQKSGATDFEVTSIEVDADADIFMPVSALNQLRREGLALLKTRILEAYDPAYQARKAIPYKGGHNKKCKISNHQTAIHVLVNSREQLLSAFQGEADRIYIDKLKIDEELLALLTAYKEKNHLELYLAFPYIVREQSYTILDRLYHFLNTPIFDGALVRNLETIAYLNSCKNKKKLVADCNLYCFNSSACEFLKGKTDEIYFPVELNHFEWEDLYHGFSSAEKSFSVMAYGRLPMMISAGCLQKTTGECDHFPKWNKLTDRYQKQFPVYNDCTYCYNIIYNCVPLSLHKLFDKEGIRPSVCRLDFTVEEGKEAGKILAYFNKIIKGNYAEPFYKEFTTGHYKRGVE